MIVIEVRKVFLFIGVKVLIEKGLVEMKEVMFLFIFFDYVFYLKVSVILVFDKE